MNDRIKLAEAMGWTNTHMKYIAMEEKSYPFGCVPGNVNDKHLKEQIPDPFTDANDDYAVLEHFRCRLGGWDKFCNEMDAQFSENVKKSSLAIDYQIGDYARAALKVIE